MWHSTMLIFCIRFEGDIEKTLLFIGKLAAFIFLVERAQREPSESD